MIYDWKMELYWRLPVRLQEAALSLYARYLDKVYYGTDYEEYKQWLMGWRTWSRSYIEEWKSQRLKYIIGIAAQRVPYYRKSWNGLDWKAIQSEDDLHILPFINKQSIRQNENEFIVDNLNLKSLWLEKTSGTTGTPLRIYQPMSMLPQWWALYEVMVRYVAGVAQEIPRAMMAGRPVVAGNTNQPPYWRFNRRWKQLYLSSYHVSKVNAAEYVAALKKYGSQWLIGYGSAIAALADSALEAGLELHPLKSVIVSSDTLLPGMRRSIEKYFQCKCFDSYGQSEGVAFAQECAYGQMHVIPMYGIIEILREDGVPCRAGEIGEMVVTGLLNDAMPLIRYRIGDYAAWAEEKDCPCGNQNPAITDLIGRVDDYLITPDGRKIGRLAAMKRSPTIHSAQVVQDKPGHAYLLVRPGDGYRPSHAVAVCADIVEKIGTFELEVIEVVEIPKTPQGKTVLVVRLGDRPEMKEIYEKLLNKKFY